MARFIEISSEKADIESPDEARNTVESVLEILGESISHGQAADLAQPLDDQFANILLQAEPTHAQPPDVEEFITRVADRLSIDADEAMRRCRAVIAALSETVGVEEVENTHAQFPPAYDVLFEPAMALGENSFAEALQERGDFDSRQDALRAAEATLRTLGERLSKGEAEAVAKYLPEEPGGWLVPDAPGEAGDFSFDEFVDRVASRADVSTDQAVQEAEAVTDVVAAMVGEEELEQMESQLPESYEPMFH